MRGFALDVPECPASWSFGQTCCKPDALKPRAVFLCGFSLRACVQSGLSRFMEYGVVKDRRAETRIEPPAWCFTAMKTVWPWAYRTFHRDLQLRGFRDFVAHFWEALHFDRRHGVRTDFLVPSTELGFEDRELQSHSARHRSTPAFGIRTGLDRLAQRIGGLQDEVLVDYGCGAGRVLIIAAQAGARGAIGVELSPHLVELAQVNLENYVEKSGSGAGLSVLQVDATSYVPPSTATIFYFFAPFHDSLFDQALNCIRQSVLDHPRDIYVMLFMCSHFKTEGLHVMSEVTGVQTLTNALDRDAFVKVLDTV